MEIEGKIGWEDEEEEEEDRYGWNRRRRQSGARWRGFYTTHEGGRRSSRRISRKIRVGPGRSCLWRSVGLEALFSSPPLPSSEITIFFFNFYLSHVLDLRAVSEGTS